MVSYWIESAAKQQDKPGYILLPLHVVRENEEKLRRLTLTPIVIQNFEKIPEFIDEIFKCKPVRQEIIENVRLNKITLKVAAASVDGKYNDNEFNHEIISLLSNATEPKTHQSVTDRDNKRFHGPLKKYLKEFKHKKITTIPIS